jgi:hypothetical protein
MHTQGDPALLVQITPNDTDYTPRNTVSHTFERGGGERSDGGDEQ